MLSACCESGRQISAKEAVVFGGEYTCPKCHAPVVLRSGLVKVDHFAHASYSSCDYAGESPLHLQIKSQIYRYLRHEYGDRVVEIAIEKPLGTVRPDVYLRGHRHQIAIEVQASTLTPKDIIRRTEEYCRLGIHVLWVVPYEKKRFFRYNHQHQCDELIPFKVKEFERIIIQMGFKSLLLWDVDQDFNEGFIAIKVGDSYTEGVDFYSKDRGEHVSYASRKQKTKKVMDRMRRHVDLSDLEFRTLKYSII